MIIPISVMTMTVMNNTLKRVVAVLAVLVSALLFVFCPSVYADETDESTTELEYIVTIVCLPQFETNQYSIITVSIISQTTGKNYKTTLTGFNNFSEKIALPPGNYAMISALVESDVSIVPKASNVEFSVHGNTDFVFELYDTNLIESKETTTAEERGTVATTALNNNGEKTTNIEGLTTSADYSIQTGEQNYSQIISSMNNKEKTSIDDPFRDDTTTEKRTYTDAVSELSTQQSNKNIKTRELKNKLPRIIFGLIVILGSIVGVIVLKNKNR